MLLSEHGRSGECARISRALLEKKDKQAKQRCVVKGCKRCEIQPTRCKLCKIIVCIPHRLPEDHSCGGKEKIWELQLPTARFGGLREKRVAVEKNAQIHRKQQLDDYRKLQRERNNKEQTQSPGEDGNGEPSADSWYSYCVLS
jgi:hypothetical protein